MDKLTDNRFLLSFEGRINRFKYWYALFASGIFCLVLMSILAHVIGGIFGATVKSVDVNIVSVFNLSPSFPFRASFKNADPETTVLVSLIFRVVGTPIFAVGLWFLAVATIKRLHDRDKSGWWILVFFIAPHLLGKIGDLVLGDSSAADIATDVLVLNIVCLNFWGIVELMFLQGTRGPNRFGPDPLAPAIPDPPAAACWDQSSELEFVPHRASPSPGAHVMRGHD